MYVRAAGLSAPGAEVDARGRDNFCSVGVRVQGVKVVRRRVAFVARYVLGARCALRGPCECSVLWFREREDLCLYARL